MDAEVPGLYQKPGRQGGRSKKLIEEGDGEANYAYYALHKLHILPSTFLEMEEEEKAFVIAAIKIKVDNDKKERKRAERKPRRRR